MLTNNSPKKAIVIGASSDIGTALCNDWLTKNWDLAGTYRTKSGAMHDLSLKINHLYECDLSSIDSIDKACSKLNASIRNWEVLVFGPGLQEPVGAFESCNFDEWTNSIAVNFTNQLRILHRLLSNRNQNCYEGPTVIFFAGGGVNNAPINYSAYTSSKIALIKIVELLAAEIPDTKFVIVGPGWVKTKIHNSILEAGDKAGDCRDRVIQRFKNDIFTPMVKVIECCNALIDGPKSALTGRNFSVEFDRWNDPHLFEMLANSKDVYKLRRHGNEL